MRALTIRQPYASLIVNGGKQVENRSRPTSIHGLIVIHAAKELHDRYVGVSRPAGEMLPVLRLPRSSIVGTAQLVDCHNSETCRSRFCGEGAEYPGYGEPSIFHWVLANPREFVTPIPRVKGMLGFWTPTDSDRYLIENAEVAA